jgi:acetyl esterase
MAYNGQARVPVKKADVSLLDREIEISRGRCVPVRIARPPKHRDYLPAVIYFHGGGWIVNDRETHDRLIREIAVRAEAAVIFVEYSRSPEAHFPVAIEEAYGVTLRVAEYGWELGVDPEKIAVMGDSAGGNMATVVAMLVKQRGGPRICAQVLLHPTTDCNFETGSYRQFGSGYFLTKKDMEWYWSQYAPDERLRVEPTASPLKATLDQLAGLPPALIITAECDVVRDEAEAYARQLAQAGVPVTATRYLGTIHGFTFLNILAETPAASAAIAQAVDMLRHAFE